eukprot:9014025-Pyramimonas_sp.AAC.1
MEGSQSSASRSRPAFGIPGFHQQASGAKLTSGASALARPLPCSAAWTSEGAPALRSLWLEPLWLKLFLEATPNSSSASHARGCTE